MNDDTTKESTGESSGLRTAVIGAVEGGSFNFAMGCIVQFWALFVQYGCAEYGIPGSGVSMAMYAAVVLLASETIASFIGASIVERLERRKLFVVSMGMCTHGAWVLFGFIILWAPLTWFLPLAFLLLLWRGFFDGMLIAPWFDLAARVVPPRDRATFFSARLFSTSATLLLGAAAARFIFGVVGTERMQFAWIFWVGGAAALMSDVARMAYREKATAVRQERRDRTFVQDLRDMGRLLGANRYFARLCLASAAGALTFLLYPQLVSLLAANRVGLSNAGYASLTVVLQASGILSCLYLPRLVKRFGWRITQAVFLAMMGTAIGSNGIVALLVPSIDPHRAAGALAAAFVVIGASRAWIFAEANVLYELTSDEKRPSYLVLLRLVSNSVGIAVALVFGYFSVRERAEAVPYAPMFFGITAAMLGACLLLLFGIRTREDMAAAGGEED